MRRSWHFLRVSWVVEGLSGSPGDESGQLREPTGASGATGAQRHERVHHVHRAHRMRPPDPHSSPVRPPSHARSGPGPALTPSTWGSTCGQREWNSVGEGLSPGNCHELATVDRQHLAVSTMSVSRNVLFEDDVELAPGREWHSKPIQLRPGDRIVVSATGTHRFYAGLFDRVTYHSLVGRESGAFGFEFGADRRGFTDSVRAAAHEDYYIVLRVGVFGDRTTIHLRVELQTGGD